MTRSTNFRSATSGFVADGHQHALDGIEAEVRRKIEQKYADELNASGFVQRWILMQKIEREIAASVAEHSAHISPESLF